MGEARTGVGTLIDGKYLLEYLIGQGGSAKVYRARQRSTGQAVAVKVLDADPLAGEASQRRRRRRFRREMKICGELNHPAIVGLIDYGETGDALYTVFELLPGATLRQQIAIDGALSMAESCALMTQLLEVLAYTHARGIIHRDLKPSNLMVLRESARTRLWVLDFGISALRRPLSSSSLTRMTVSQEAIGTPAYAAPEQLRGEAPTPKTDLYAWGLILLECLTGTGAVPGGSIAELLQRQLSLEPVPLPPGLREHPLGTLLGWVLDKVAARRASSAEATLARLSAIELDSFGALVDTNGYLVASSGPSQLPSLGDETLVTMAMALEDERRQVSVLCCRLLFEVRGPELDEAVLDAHRSELFALAQAIIAGYGGASAGGFGDLALFHFGIPRARDTDARMAARAALELSARLDERSEILAEELGLRVVLRAGLHAGLLTIAQASATTALAHSSVAAVATTLSFRAGGDERGSAIRTSEAFRALIARYEEFGAQPGDEATLTLPWRLSPLQIHTLTSESPRSAQLYGAQLSGRQAELDALLDAWRERNERTRVVLLRGEAGMGKSRLAAELRKAVRGHGCDPLALRCLPELQHVALGPVLELLRAELGLDARSHCTDVALALDGFELDSPEHAVPLLCLWTGIPLEPPFGPLPFSPPKQRAMFFALVRELFMALVRQRETYLELEDLHWADALTLEWLGLWCAGLGPGDFTVMTARPDFEPCWEQVEVDMLELAPLPPTHVAELVAALPDGAQLDTVWIEEIIARADGVPLFVEELVRTFVERAAGAEGRASMSDVPATLRDLMMSRLDALGPAKESAQFAAAIGREFDVELLCATRSGTDESEVLAELSALIEAGIVVEERRLAQQVYMFRHALLRDAAYESMTAAGLQLVHRAIADVLLNASERAEARPDLIALHLERGGLAARSAEYWMKATSKALSAGIDEEALRHIEGGLRALAGLNDEAAAREQALGFRAQEMNALMSKYQGMPSPTFAASLAQATALLDQQAGAGAAHLLAVRRGQWFFAFTSARLDEAQVAARELLALAEAGGEPIAVLAAQNCMCQTAFFRGDFAEVLVQFERCAALYPSVAGVDVNAVLGSDPYIDCASFAALSLLICGEIGPAIELHEAVLKRSRALDLPGLLAGILGNSGTFYGLAYLASDPDMPALDQAVARAAEAGELAVEYGYPLWEMLAGFWCAIIPATRGGPESAPLLLGLRDTLLAAPLGLTSTLLLLHLAQALARAGEEAAATDLLDRALAYAETSGERFLEAELLRTRAGLLGAGDPAAHESALRQALACSRRGRGARLFEARALRELEALAPTDELSAQRERMARWWHQSGALAQLPSLRRWLEPA